MMEFGEVVVGVDSKDKYTKNEENVSNHEHLQFNHNNDHHHTRKSHVPRSMLKATYILPSPKELTSSIHAQRRGRRRRRGHVVWS